MRACVPALLKLLSKVLFLLSKVPFTEIYREMHREVDIYTQ